MSYAGITKGFTALGAAMMLAATRGGSAEALKAELAESQSGPERLPDAQYTARCIRKPIAGSPNSTRLPPSSARTMPENEMFAAAARFYERIAEDFDGEKKEIGAMDKFCREVTSQSVAAPRQAFVELNSRNLNLMTDQPDPHPTRSRLPHSHAQPAGQAQRLQRRHACGAARGHRRGRSRRRLPRADDHRRRPRLLRRPGPAATACSSRAKRRSRATRWRSITIRWCGACARLPFPVIAAVNGVAAGAGANIALACDIVIAGKSASFIQSFARIGLVPDSGGTWFLPRLVGDARARGLALIAQELKAEKAAEWGMIWRCVADDALIYEARRICEHFSIAPTQGLALIKRALNASADQRSRHPARSRTRSAKAGQHVAGLRRGRARLHGKAQTEISRPQEIMSHITRRHRHPHPYRAGGLPGLCRQARDRIRRQAMAADGGGA